MQIRVLSDRSVCDTEAGRSAKEDCSVNLAEDGSIPTDIPADYHDRLVGFVDGLLDAADFQAENTDVRLSHDDVFGTMRTRFGGV